MLGFMMDFILKASNKVELLLRIVDPAVRRGYEKSMKGFDVLYVPSYSPYGYSLIPPAWRLGKRLLHISTTTE